MKSQLDTRPAVGQQERFTINRDQSRKAPGFYETLPMNLLEVEVKFLMPDLERFRSRLRAAGAKLEKARQYQRNVVFDTPDDLLFGRGEMLRLRQGAVTLITFKGAPEIEEQSEAKVHLEIETQVGSFDMATSILHRLGFVEKRVYERYRETYHLGEVEVLLDEMPFGGFIELEGDERAIKKAAGSLGLDWRKRMTENYLQLMDLLKDRFGLQIDDVTFANFEQLSVSPAHLFAHLAEISEERR